MRTYPKIPAQVAASAVYIQSEEQSTEYGMPILQKGL